ncbi:MAG: hypothetical protein HY023_14175 [Chloroflexi bacterium]|nr:hypothetical protein [Chloroflexota bacterium]
MKTLQFWPIAWTLAIFAAVVFTLDVLLGALFPNWWVMQKIYELLLPGFTFISLGTFILGLLESFVGGFLTAVLFVPLYNYFAGQATHEAPMPTPTMTASPHH